MQLHDNRTAMTVALEVDETKSRISTVRNGFSFRTWTGFYNYDRTHAQTSDGSRPEFR